MKFLPLTLAALGLATILAVPTLTQAAPGGRSAKAPGARMQKLAAALGLTDAQKAQLKPILKDARQQAEAIKADTSLTPEARKDKMKELRRSTKQQMMTVLTPDQLQKMKELRQQRRAAKA